MTAPELLRLRTPGNPWVAFSKVSICLSVVCFSGSSADAKWDMSVIDATA
jgi:hypothetical protein